MRRLLAYDPDQIQMLYVTPHRWTPYFRLAAKRRVIEADRRRWDYKHQVLATRHMAPWRVLLWVKFTEMVLQCRPKALRRTYMHPDRSLRHAMRWYAQMGRRVWPHEIIGFLRKPPRRSGLTLAQFWGAQQEAEEELMEVAAPIQLEIANPGAQLFPIGKESVASAGAKLQREKIRSVPIEDETTAAQHGAIT